MKELSVEILAVGTELLLGDIANTDAQFLSRQLAGLGIPVYGHTVVGDNPTRLRAALEGAFSRASMVVTVGGLGPTQDDLTKEVAAAYFGKKLVLDAEAFARIEKRFAHVKLPENVHKNAQIPEGARTLPNDHGSAPGIWLEQDGKTLLMLPGPPHELEPMFIHYAVPFLREKTGVGEAARTFISRTLKFIGIGESSIEARLLDLFEKQTNPTLALYAKVWECHLRITAAAPCEEEARALITPAADEIYARLGEFIYGEDEATLAEIVLDLLAGKTTAGALPRTLAIAESCTGGLVTSALVAVAGSSAVLREGLITYSNEAKIARLNVPREIIEKYGAVSPQCAAAMAEGAAKTSGADIGLSTTGIAGPDGGTAEKPVGTVFIGLHIKGRDTQTLALTLSGERNPIRERSAMLALNFLRKNIIAPTITCPNCGQRTRDEISIFNKKLRKQNFALTPILPICRQCNAEVQIKNHCNGGNIVVLNGTCGSGKSTVAEKLMQKGFLAIDGDCVMQAVKHKIGAAVHFQDAAMVEAIAYALDVLSIYGNNFVLAHVLMPEDINKYIEIFEARSLTYQFFLLKPEYETAVARCQARTCHTSVTPTEWIKHFYDALSFDDSVEVVDSTFMTASETADYILKKTNTPPEAAK